MLSVTQAAGARLARKLAKKRASDDVALRCVPRRSGHGWRLRLDNARSGDVTFTHDGRTVLLLDAEVSESLANRTLDVNDSGARPRLSLR